MHTHFSTVPSIHFGRGCISELGPTVAQFGRRALLVTGRRAVRQAGITERVLEELGKSGVEARLFEEVEPDPQVDTVDRARLICRREYIEVVVGVGGGSALDAAKVSAGLAHELPSASEYHGERTPHIQGLPFVAVPTTAGTGAEVTPNGIISDPERGVKASIRHPSFLARAAVVDPELTLSVPADVTANTGLDAFVQAVESYTSRNAWPLTEGISLRAAQAIAANIRRVWQDGQDRDARTAMSAGSLLAGIALANARLGIVHGLAHELGIRLGLPHGLVCGVLLPHAVELNREVAWEKYDGLASAIGVEVAELARELLREFGLPTSFRSAGLTEEMFPDIVKVALASGSTAANPKDIAEADVLALLEKVAG